MRHRIWYVVLCHTAWIEKDCAGSICRTPEEIPVLFIASAVPKSINRHCEMLAHSDNIQLREAFCPYQIFNVDSISVTIGCLSMTHHLGKNRKPILTLKLSITSNSLLVGDVQVDIWLTVEHLHHRSQVQITGPEIVIVTESDDLSMRRSDSNISGNRRTCGSASSFADANQAKSIIEFSPQRIVSGSRRVT